MADRVPILDPDPGWQAELDYVREAHPLRQRSIDDHCWEYILCGSGPETIVVLPGGLAVAETAFYYIRRLEPHYRVLAPTYPETVRTMADLVEGLVKLLEAEQVFQFHVIGGSYSGLVAQCLVRHRPALVQKLVLSDTGVPRPTRLYQFALYQPLLKYLPLSWVRALLRLGTALFLINLSTQREFWWRYFSQRITMITRAACLSHLATWQDFDRFYRFAPGDLANWGGCILIIEAEADGLFRRSERLALRRLYPSARSFTFEKNSHCASLAQMDDYLRVIVQFLTDQRELG